MWPITKIIKPRPVSAMTYFEPTDESTNRDNRFILILSTTKAGSRLKHCAGLLYSL
jgi:hypothetical protein